MIKFSIITVCLDAGDDLIDTVASVLRQTYNNYEIIVKDGVSQDGSIEKLPQDSKIKLVQKKDQGIYDAMNQGIELASGDYCLFINAGDTLYDENTLQGIADYIVRNPGEFYYGKSYTVSSGVMNYGPEKITKCFCFRTTMCHQAMIIQLSFLKARGYNTKYRITADREWMVYAFMQVQMKFVRMPIMVSNYKGGGISSSSDIREVVRKETQEINKTFFSWWERVLFTVVVSLTLPRLRRRISSNPRFKSTYYKIRYKILSRR